MVSLKPTKTLHLISGSWLWPEVKHKWKNRKQGRKEPRKERRKEGRKELLWIKHNKEEKKLSHFTWFSSVPETYICI